MKQAQSNAAQMDLFAEVMHAYAGSDASPLANRELYEIVAERSGISHLEKTLRQPVGSAGQPHNLFSRRVRWFQQTLKHAGVIEHVEGDRGVWRLTQPAGKDLSKITSGVSVVGFSTNLGVAILGSCDTVFSARFETPIVLALTSPPYPLAKQRHYGNPSLDEYIDWVVRMLEPIVKNLARGGSIALNISNDIYVPGLSARSLYREELVIALCKKLGLYKMDELVWRNTSKPPGPVQWASLERVQLNQTWEPVYWFTNDPRAVRSDNRRVLQEHTDRHLQLIHNGGEKLARASSDGAYRLREGSFGNATAGRIPRNVLDFSHNCRDQQLYKKAARAAGLPAHGAPMPLALAKFLIEFLTKPGDLVVDPFGGSQTTAKAAELLNRHWLTTECMVQYVLGGATRFVDCEGFELRIAA